MSQRIIVEGLKEEHGFNFNKIVWHNVVKNKNYDVLQYLT